MKMRNMVLTALFAACICVIAPFSVPIGPVPITLATLMVYLSGAVLGPKFGPAAVLLYIALGAIGLPVFSGFTGGVQRLVGPTGGFFPGYVVCAWVCGMMPRLLRYRRWSFPLSMAVGTAVLYAFGLFWFAFQSGVGIARAAAVCALPFLPGDTVKIIAVSILAPIMRRAVWRQRDVGAEKGNPVYKGRGGEPGQGA